MHYLVENFPYLFQRIIRTDFRVDDFCRELLYYFPVFYSRFYELRANHYAIVRYGIVECQYIHRGHLRFVPDTHPREGSLGKITFFRSSDVGLSLSCDLQVQRLVDAHSFQSVYELLRVVMIELVDDAGCPHVGRHFQDTGYVDSAISAAMPVPVFHRPSVHHFDTVSRIHFVIGGDVPVFKSHHDRSCLKGGTRFEHVADGIVTHFVIIAVRRFHHVDDCFHLACGDFH